MPTTDTRLFPVAAATWGVAWVTPLLPSSCVWVGVVVSALGAVIAIRRTRHVVAASLLCAAAAGTAAGLRTVVVQGGTVSDLAGQRAVASVQLVVTSDPQLRATRGPAARSTRVVLRARVERVTGRGRSTHVRVPVLVIADPDDRGWLGLVPGSRIQTSGRLSPARSGDSFAAVIGARAPPEGLGGPPLVQRVAAELRAGLRDAVSSLPARERGLIPGLVVGDTSRLPPQLEQDFRTTGLAHLLAVSGANVAIVLGVVLFSARWAGLRGRMPAVAGALAIGAFVILARPEPSVLRAAVMGLVIVAALASGRRRQGLPALCAAVLVLVLVDPVLARSYGFALSVLATGSILLLAPVWREFLMRRRWPRPLADAVAVPAAAQAACGPVVAMMAAQVSLVAIPANLLVAPAVPAATVLGVLAAATQPVAPPLAAVFGGLAGVPAWWMVQVAQRGADLPSAAVAWPGGFVGGVVLAGVTLAAVLVVAMVLRLRLLHARERIATCLLLVLVVIVGLLAVPGQRRLTLGWPPDGWIFVVCDVGQGDALAVSAGDGAALVVDAGPDPDRVDRCLRDLGVRHIPVLVLTHMHADHVDGLPGVLRGRTVDELQLGPLHEPRAQAAEVAREARDADLTVTLARVGEERRAGPLSWRVLWPRRIIATDESVPNNASVVLLAQRSGVRMLLAGDVEPAAQRALLAAGPQDLLADVLKVPHHSSRYQDSGFLAAVAPRVAIVSVGADNDYGHPSATTLDLIRRLGARTLRTDRDGDVAVVGSSDDLRVVARSPAAADSASGNDDAMGHAVLAVVPRPRRWRRRARVGFVIGARR